VNDVGVLQEAELRCELWKGVFGFFLRAERGEEISGRGGGGDGVKDMTRVRRPSVMRLKKGGRRISMK